MYLLTSDRAILRPNRHVKQCNVIELGQGALVWLDDAFTRIEQQSRTLVIDVRRPKIDISPICRIEWNLDSSRISVARSWSGEFTCYLSEQPQLVTSHRRFAAALIDRELRLQAVSPGAVCESRFGCDQTFRKTSPSRPMIQRMSRSQTVAQVRRLVSESVRRCARDGDVLMLSGGVDSSIIAAVAASLGIRIRAITYTLQHPPRVELQPTSDRLGATCVAAHLSLPHQILELQAHTLSRNVPLAVFLSETSRGTIVDELTAHIEVARHLQREGVTSVLTGEGADDIFGAFPSALRFYQGADLARFLRSELLEGLPDELAEIQNAYAAWDIALIHPYWTEELRSIGFSLPVTQRIDRRRLMKGILRDAFADLLPSAVIQRAKGVPRDCTQIRHVLEAEFGTSQNRYRSMLGKMNARRPLWLNALPPLPKKSSDCVLK